MGGSLGGCVHGFVGVWVVVASVRTWLIVCFRYCAVDGDHLSHHLLFFSFFFCVRPCSGIVRRIYCCTAVVLLLCCCCAIIVRKMWVHGVGVGCFFSDVCCAVLPLYWYQVRRTAAVDTTYCWTSTRWLGGSVQGCVHVLVCLLYTSPSPRDKRQSRMPSSA